MNDSSAYISVFFAFDILFSILTWSAIRSLSVEISFFFNLFQFFFFNVVNMLLPLKNIFTYLPPTAFSYFIMLSLFFGQFVSFTFASGWLKDTDHELIRRVSQRFEDVTGLTMDTAEELQV